MNELKVTGKQSFMGVDIPVVLGGFGEGKKCVSDKMIAEIHNMETKNVRARITDNIKRFMAGTDYIDLKKGAYETSTLDLLESMGYSKQSITQAEHIYILSERGYAKLIKIMDSDLAWEIHDKLIDEYFTLKKEKSIFNEFFEDSCFNLKKERCQDILPDKTITTAERIKMMEIISNCPEQSLSYVVGIAKPFMAEDVIDINPVEEVKVKEEIKPVKRIVESTAGYAIPFNATRLKRHLSSVGWTYAKLAYESGIGVTQIRRYIIGKNRPSQISRSKICSALGKKPGWLNG